VRGDPAVQWGPTGRDGAYIAELLNLQNLVKTLFAIRLFRGNGKTTRPTKSRLVNDPIPTLGDYSICKNPPGNHDLLSAGIGDLGKQHDQTNRSWDTNRFLALSTKSVTETFSEPRTGTVGAPYLSNGTGVPHRVFEKYQEIVCFV